MDNINELGLKISEINNSLTDEVIKKASNEELMAYLVLVEKMKRKLEKAFDM